MSQHHQLPVLTGQSPNALQNDLSHQLIPKPAPRLLTPACSGHLYRELLPKSPFLSEARILLPPIQSRVYLEHSVGPCSQAEVMGEE